MKLQLSSIAHFKDNVNRCRLPIVVKTDSTFCASPGSKWKVIGKSFSTRSARNRRFADDSVHHFPKPPFYFSTVKMWKPCFKTIVLERAGRGSHDPALVRPQVSNGAGRPSVAVRRGQETRAERKSALEDCGRAHPAIFEILGAKLGGQKGGGTTFSKRGVRR